MPQFNSMSSHCPQCGRPLTPAPLTALIVECSNGHAYSSLRLSSADRWEVESALAVATCVINGRQRQLRQLAGELKESPGDTLWMLQLADDLEPIVQELTRLTSRYQRMFGAIF